MQVRGRAERADLAIAVEPGQRHSGRLPSEFLMVGAGPPEAPEQQGDSGLLRGRVLQARVALSTVDVAMILGPNNPPTLAVMTVRWFTAPDIPAIAETVPGFFAMSWHGVAYPAGTSPAIVDKLAAAIQRAMATAEMQEKFALGGSKATSMTPREFAAFIREDTERWAPIIRASGARVE